VTARIVSQPVGDRKGGTHAAGTSEYVSGVVSLDTLIYFGVVAAVALLAVVPILVGRARHNRAVGRKLETAKRLGYNETLTLHPRVDDGKCIACRECVRACPEQDVLDTFRGKAVVVNATECVGHGLCERACPVGAITLVVGTETRGLEIPRLTEHFESSVQGLYVVGELGGMGLIRNAIWQATQAIAHVVKAAPRAPADGVQVLIAGAGPAGLAAAITAKAAGLTFQVLEQSEMGGSMLHYPRRKLVMTHPATLPGVGPFPFREVEKEPLIRFWRATADKLGIAVHEQTTLLKIERLAQGFLARTTRGDYRAGAVILALGRRGSPRRLEVPGEQCAKVMYRLLEPEQFDGRPVLVVGGGSAALEAALSLAERPGTAVTLCHRRDVFAGSRAALIDKLLAAERAGRVEVLRNARVTLIADSAVTMDVAGASVERANDAVFVMIGGTPPYELLKASGIDLEKKFGAPLR
jgi:thioredoxin reductase/Pyruvate/2-oxoacid:ferredoxin oxidoreductase delta subunit